MRVGGELRISPANLLLLPGAALLLSSPGLPAVLLRERARPRGGVERLSLRRNRRGRGPPPHGPPSFEKFPPSFEKSQNWGGSFPPAFGWQNLKFSACGGLKLREY